MRVWRVVRCVFARFSKDFLSVFWVVLGLLGIELSHRLAGMAKTDLSKELDFGWPLQAGRQS